MQENIDLTENRDFRKESLSDPRVAFLQRTIVKVIDKNRFNVPNENSYIEKDSGGIIQGNSSFRYTKRIVFEFGKGNYCDRCGVSIKPYVNDCLCSRCYHQIEGRDMLW